MVIAVDMLADLFVIRFEKYCFVGLVQDEVNSAGLGRVGCGRTGGGLAILFFVLTFLWHACLIVQEISAC